MPKNRQRANQKGAKSIAVRTKHKVGGRKSSRGVKHMSEHLLTDTLEKARPRDAFKIIRELNRRGTFVYNLVMA